MPFIYIDNITGRIEWFGLEPFFKVPDTIGTGEKDRLKSYKRPSLLLQFAWIIHYMDRTFAPKILLAINQYEAILTFVLL